MAAIKLFVGSHVIRLEENSSGGFRLLAEGPNGDGRFLEIKDGGGHIELEAPGSITTGTGLELDGDGRAVFHPLNG